VNYWYIPSGGQWGAVTVSGANSVYASPAVVAQPNGAPTVFVQGPGGVLDNYWYIPPSGSWGLATVAGANATSTPAGVLPSANMQSGA